MKKLLTLILFLFSFGLAGFAQTISSNLLTKFHNVTNTNMNNMVSPQAGMLLYNTDTGRLAVHSGTQWLIIPSMQDVITPPYIQITNTLSGDVNGSTPTPFTWWNTSPSTMITNAASLFTVATDGITVLQAGVYRVTVNQYLVGNKNDQSPGFRFTINGVPQPGAAANGWLKAMGSSNTSLSLTQLMNFTAGNKVSIQNERNGQNDPVTCPAGNTFIILERMR